jgi:hypothetical protein
MYVFALDPQLILHIVHIHGSICIHRIEMHIFIHMYVYAQEKYRCAGPMNDCMAQLSREFSPRRISMDRMPVSQGDRS